MIKLYQAWREWSTNAKHAQDVTRICLLARVFPRSYHERLPLRLIELTLCHCGKFVAFAPSYKKQLKPM